MSSIFELGIDDYTFPITHAGIREAGMIFESAQCEEDEEGICESAADRMATQQSRQAAMGAVLSWVDQGQYDYDYLDGAVAIMADIDDDDPDEDDEATYNEVWAQVPDALLTLGAAKDDVQELVNGPGRDADKAAARIGKDLSASMDEMEADDDELITAFSLGEDAVFECAAPDRVGILEASYKKAKVIRNGGVKIINKRISGKVRLSGDQKMHLKKIRRLANTSAAKQHRKKSMRIRKNRGL